MKNSIKDALELLSIIKSKLQGNNANVDGATDVLKDLSRLLGGGYELDDEVSRYIDSGEQYKSRLSQSLINSDDFNLWAKELYCTLLSLEKNCRDAMKQINQTSQKALNYISAKNKTRQCVIIAFLILVICIAFVAAAIAVYGMIKSTDWADSWASILGTIDFAIGILGFSIERISDIKAQNISRSLDEMRMAQSSDLQQAEEIAKRIEVNIRQRNIFGDNINVSQNTIIK